jgi:hypothetical protein
MTPTPTWTRFEEDDSRLRFDPPWPISSSTLCSGGWYKVGLPGSKVELEFEGTRIRYVARMSQDACIAMLTLDGEAFFNVDLCSEPGTAPSRVVWTSPVLAFGTHELEIAWTEDSNPAAIPTRGGLYLITLDAVDVIGTLVD